MAFALLVVQPSAPEILIRVFSLLFVCFATAKLGTRYYGFHRNAADFDRYRSPQTAAETRRANLIGDELHESRIAIAVPSEELLAVNDTLATNLGGREADWAKQPNMQRHSTTERRQDGIGIPSAIRSFAVANENRETKDRTYEDN